MKRIICLVADGFGVGEAPDAAKYGDAGSNTLGHIAAHVGKICLPNLEKLGIGNLGNFLNIAKASTPLALISRLQERSEGKDTTTGHWELAGLVTRKPFAVFPNGFPKELIDAFIKETGVPGILGNKHASGTQIIDELGEEHLRTGKPIVYTSADSVFQIAAHEEKFGIDRLRKVSEIARKLTIPYQIGRVIARPFLGDKLGEFKRTERRRDYAIEPGPNCLDLLVKSGVRVCSVGKIDDIFANRSISEKNHTGNNADSLRATLDFMVKHRADKAFIFTNLVDFDMLYGHRRDATGYAHALEALDIFLPKILSEMTSEDLLLITSDHGCDPTFKGTDHTREYVPLIAYSPNHAGGRLEDQKAFADVAATVLQGFGVSAKGLPDVGESFLWKS